MTRERLLTRVVWMVLMIGVGCTMIWVGASVKGQSIHAERELEIDATYKICQESRMDPAISERQCAELQDAFNVEYLCSGIGTQADMHCFVEDKR